MSKFKISCEENTFIYEKLENLRKKLLQSKDDQKARNAKRILSAIERFPLPILSSKTALTFIQGVGPWWASEIEKWLSQKPQKRKASPIINTKRVLYIPTYKSPEWVCMMCMNISESPIASYDIPYIVSHFLNDYDVFAPENAKSVLGFLCDKNLAIEDSGLYNLTDLGAEIIGKIQAECPTIVKKNVEKFDPDSWITENCEKDEEITNNSDFFSIVLIVDTAERLAMDFNTIFDRLCCRNIAVERRKLWVGDYQWICRTKENGKTVDLALNLVVERKTADDLAHSIVDFRYEEQKIKMKMSQAHCIYLLEGKNPQKSSKISTGTLLNSLISTKFNYGFQIKVTQDSKDTLNWLARLTSGIFQQVSSWSSEKLFNLPTFDDFYDETNPFANITVKEIFGKQLRALDKIGEQNTLAVLKKYPTPFIFYSEISSAAKKGKRSLNSFLKSIKLDNGNILNKNTNT